MQRFIVFSKNKIFYALTIIFFIAVFCIIRECDYPLLIDSKIAKAIFIPLYKEKLLYNLSLSFIAAYVFYVIQIFIPQTIMNKKACNILVKHFQQEFRLTKEFLFLVNQIIKMREGSQIQYKTTICPVYFKESDYNNTILKRFSEIDTLEQLAENIEQQVAIIENNRYYDELDLYIVEVHSMFPLSEIQQCLDCIKYSLNSINNLDLVSNNLLFPIEQFLNQMARIMPKCTEVAMLQCTDTSLIRKYDNAVKAAGLDEVRFALRIKESNLINSQEVL